MQTGARPDVDRSQGVFETVLTVDGRPVELERHLRRAARSTQLLFGTSAVPGAAEVSRVAGEVPRGRGRLRIDLVPAGRGIDATITCTPLPLGAGEVVDLAPVAAAGGLGEHKWRDRSWLDRAAASVPGALPLLVDGDDVLEASRSNVFAVVDGVLVTPPLDGRILPGTGRARVVERLAVAGVEVREARLTFRELAGASEVFLVNALRGVEVVGSGAGVGAWPAGPVAERAGALLDADRDHAVARATPSRSEEES